MAHVPDSHGTSLGHQVESQKENPAAYSFGTASRDQVAKKVFISKKHWKTQAILQSPGPVYSVPTTVGDTAKFSFGTAEQRPHIGSTKYDDSSVDLTCALVDVQPFRYGNQKSVHFGTEARMNKKNGEVAKNNAPLLYGTEAPCALEYTPRETLLLKKVAAYSFGPPNFGVTTSGKPTQRMPPLQQSSTPRTVGPGTHTLPSSTGYQTTSQHHSQPSWRFGSSCRVSIVNESTEISIQGKSMVFEISLTKNGGADKLGVKLGIDLSSDGDCLRIKSIMKGGLISQWNQENKDKEVKPFDRIIEVNQIRGEQLSLKKALMSDAKVLTILIKRELSEDLLQSSPRCVFGTSTREHAARTAMAFTPKDAGPVADMPRPRFHCDIPVTSTPRRIPMPGL